MAWIRFNPTSKFWEEATDETDPATLFTQLDVAAAAIVSGNLAVARMPVSGTWSLSGDLTISGAKVNVPTPTTDTEAATKKYVDDNIPVVTGFVPYTGASGDVALGAYDLSLTDITVNGVGKFVTGISTYNGTPSDAGIVLPDKIPATTTNALYNNGGALTFNGTAVATANAVVTTGSYANPTWITSLAGSKITGQAPTLGGANVTAAGNTGASETDMQSITLAAGLLATDGDTLLIESTCFMANNAASKRWRIKIGTTTIFDTNTGGFSNLTMYCRMTLIRLTSTTGTAFGFFTYPGGGVYAVQYPVAVTETWANALTLKSTGDGDNTNDLSSKTLIAILCRA